MTLESLIDLDQTLLLWFNGSDSLFLDRFVELLTSGLTWIPLYIALFYLVVKNNETMVQIALVMGCAGLCILLADGMADGIVKPLVARPRPSMDPYIKYVVNVVDNQRGSGFSFFSAHAANTMSLAVFFSLLVRNRLFNTVMIIWSLLNCWTRLYLGLHYPVDILCGMVWGVIAGLISYLVFYKLYFKFSPKFNYISSQYTATGYSRVDIDVVMMVIALILAAVMLLSLPVF
jgi:undecaprenyl-diphosphatase